MRFRREAKKVIICIILLFSVSFILLGANKELTIMSFNIACHARAERSNNNEAWVNQIVEIIKKSKAQIVLLQEVRLDRSSEELVRSFVKKLNKSGGSWNYATSVKYSISSSDLNNAVLYNSKYVALKEDLSMQLGFIDYKTNYDQNQQVDNRKYKFVKNNVQVLEFEIVGKTSKSFILVNVHLPDSDKKVDERRALESLYAYYKRKEAMAIIIGGDFNIRRKELKRGSNFSDEIIDGVSGPYSDVQGQKTTVSTVASSGIVLVNDYDHFIISTNDLFSVSEQMHLVFSEKRVDKISSMKIGKYKYTSSNMYRSGSNGVPGISDHMPIVIKLKINF